MTDQDETYFAFESFRVDVAKRRLFRGEETLQLTSKAFNTLLFLIHHRGKTVTKDELMDAVWFDTAVEENNLTQQISTLRKILGERAGEYHFIATIPKQGYSFIAPVKEIPRAEFETQTENEIVLQEYAQSNITIDISDPKEIKSAPAITKKVFPKFQTFIARRFQTTTLVLLCLFVAVAGIGVWSSAKNEIAASKPPTPKTIAVLPFKLLNTDAKDDSLGFGMSDTLITKLSSVQNLTVRPTSSVMKFADYNQDEVSAGRELKADVVLGGTVQRNGDHIRVTVQMLDVQSAKLIWGQSFDENFSDIFNLQDAISTDIARVLEVKLSDKEQKELRQHSTDNLEAFQAYTRGRYLWNKRNEESLLKGIEYFETAINLDPNYALAYSGIADSHLVMDYYHFGSFSPGENLRKAKQAALKSLELNDSIAESHTSLAFVDYFFEGNSQAAEAEFKRAIELNPNYATAHHWYSEFLILNKREEESLQEIKIAAKLDPVSSIINATLGERLYYARQYDEAIAQLRQAIEMDENFFSAHYNLGMVYEQKGMYAQAIAEFQKARHLTKDAEEFDSVLAHAYALSGNRAAAEKILDKLIKNKANPQAIAIVYTGLGDDANAVKWLKKADNSKPKWFLLNDPRLDSLKTNKDFQQILNIN